jgi:galactokinase
LSLSVSSRQLVHTALPEAELFVSAPGRVNLLGEHVDYNAGVVLPAAINKRVWLAVNALEEKILRVTSLDLDQTVAIRLTDLTAKVDVEGRPLPNWALYPAAVVWVMLAKGYELKGLHAVMASDLPMRVGLSSSAAVEVAFGLVLQTLNDIEMDRMQLAKLCQLAENRYIGVQCGLMDQFAASHGVARHALYFDTRSFEWQPIPLPADCALVIADSGKERELAHSAYNQRRQECEMALHYLQGQDSSIQSLRDVSLEQFADWKANLPDIPAKRAQHVIEEIDRVQQAALCLVQEDVERFGELLYAGHDSLRDLYEVSCAELDFLVAAAKGLPGCLGARLTGAGFGGCTVNVVQKAQAQEFAASLAAAYEQKFATKLTTIICLPDRGAFVEKSEEAV